jgi:hypothetical protein
MVIEGFRESIDLNRFHAVGGSQVRQDRAASRTWSSVRRAAETSRPKAVAYVSRASSSASGEAPMVVLRDSPGFGFSG